MNTRLTPRESELARALEAGQPPTPDPANLLPVRAAVLRSLILELPVQLDGESDPRIVPIPETGFQAGWLHVVEGELNLEDACRPFGAALKPLALESCLFDDPLRLARARLRRLSLTGSYVLHLDGKGIALEGPLDLSRLSSAEDHTAFVPRDPANPKSGTDEKGLCWLQLGNASINGDLDLTGAYLVTPPDRLTQESVSRSNYAINLNGSSIAGSLQADKIWAFGGVSLDRCTIKGNFSAIAAFLKAIEGYALSACGAEISGDVLLEPSQRLDADREANGPWDLFLARGSIVLADARLHANLYMRGATLEDSENRNPAQENFASLSAPRIHIAGNCYLKGEAHRQLGHGAEEAFLPFSVASGIDLEGAQIGGELNLMGASLGPYANNGRALFAASISVSGEVFLSFFQASLVPPFHSCQFLARGEVVFASATLKRSLTLQGAFLQLSDTANQRYSLHLVDARIEGSLYAEAVDAWNEGVWRTHRFVAYGGLLMENIYVGGDLQMAGAFLQAYGNLGIALALKRARIGKAVYCNATRLVEGEQQPRTLAFESHGMIDLEGAEIGNMLCFDGAFVESIVKAVDSGSDGSDAIIAIYVKVGAAVTFRPFLPNQGSFVSSRVFNAIGQIRFYGARLASFLIFSEARLEEFGPKYALNVEQASMQKLLLEACTVTGRISALDASILSGVHMDGLNVIRGYINLGDSTLGYVQLNNVTFEGTPADLKFLNLERSIITRKLSVGISFLPGTPPPPASGDPVEITTLQAAPSHAVPASAPDLHVDLRSLVVDELDDGNGRGWGEGVRLLLDGFVTKRTPHRDTAKLHIDWLNRQYRDPVHPTQAEFNPGPYDQLAKVLREEGFDSESKKVLSAKLTARRKVDPSRLGRIIAWIFHFGFDYGLSFSKAFTSFCACVALGFLMVFLADHDIAWLHHKSVMVVASSTVNTVVVDDASARYTTAFPYVDLHHGSVVTQEIPCGARIDPVMYAIEVFVPALDLGQTKLCEISSDDRARYWRLGRMFYAILGWIVTSITILTAPGILRSRAEG
jgi:hypothetical protein